MLELRGVYLNTAHAIRKYPECQWRSEYVSAVRGTLLELRGIRADALELRQHLRLRGLARGEAALRALQLCLRRRDLAAARS